MVRKEYQLQRNKYYKAFGDDFPNMEVGTSSHKEEIEAIKKCLIANKPAREVFNISYKDIMY